VRTLACDVGDKRIGLALSDPTGTLASSLEVWERRGDEADWAHITALVAEHQVETVLVGYPRHLRGADSAQSQAVERFVAGLKQRTRVPIVLWDERLTTVRAAQIARERGRQKGKRKKPLDSIAAAVMLQEYLER